MTQLQLMDQLSLALRETLEPANRQRAEATLQEMEKIPNFLTLLMQLIGNTQVDPSVRFAGSLLFKNTVKKLWPEEGLSEQERTIIKATILDLMINLPEKLQIQISEAVSIISFYDFPHDWDLLPLLISKFSVDFNVNLGLLTTAHSIFKRYRYATRSDDLFLEIKGVLTVFATPFLELLRATDASIQSNASNASALKVLFQCLLLLCKIFYSLNFQDIPEFFEDNQKEFMTVFLKYINFKNNLVEGSGDEEGLSEKVKSSICEIVSLYAKKYEDLFPMLPSFVESIWNLLSSLSSEAKYDQLISTAITFLASVSKIGRHKSFFSTPGAIRALCEKVILPNMQLRQVDEEMFEDDPMEFIRRDLEGSDSDTRRHASTVLVRGLLENFETELTAFFGEFIGSYLQNYSANPAQNWKDKDMVIYLLISISAKAATSQLGATKINDNINIPNMFSTHILPDLQNSSTKIIHPIIKVDALKFVIIFRHHLPHAQLSIVFPLIIDFLSNENFVVHTFAAVCLERMLSMKLMRDGKSIALFSADDLKSVLPQLLNNLFALIEKGGSPEKVSENDYLMKSLMRVISIAKGSVMPFAIGVIERLTKILEMISKNPSNPKFNHYVFETIGCLIRFICQEDLSLVQQFENLLFPVIQAILATDIPEFTPYVLQILAQLLEFHKALNEKSIPEKYKPLLQPLLLPALWESNGNIPPLVRLLEAYLEVGASQIVASNQLQAFLGVFQKLIASKVNDTFGIELLLTIYETVDEKSLATFEQTIFNLLLVRLNSTSKTQKFTVGFTKLLCSLACLKESGQRFADIFNQIQPKLLEIVLKNVLLPALSKEVITSPLQRKNYVVGLMLFFTSPSIFSSSSPALGNILEEILRISQDPLTSSAEIDATADDDELTYSADVEEAGYQSAFVKLHSIAVAQKDYATKVSDAKLFIIEELRKIHSNPIMASVQLSNKSKTLLAALLA